MCVSQRSLLNIEMSAACRNSPTVVSTVFVLARETTSRHVHVSMSIGRKLVGRRIITAESTVTSATITLLARRGLRLKGTFVEMYIDTRLHQFLVDGHARRT